MISMKLPLTSPLRRLAANFPRSGRLDWIGVRPERRTPPITLPEAVLLVDRGIEGDRKSRRSGGRRQVTLIQAEHLAVIGSVLGVPPVAPDLLRRNLVVSGINLVALAEREFAIGEALLQGTGHCHPCSRMEEALGAGGYAAMRGHGGITAVVIRGALIRVGDPVRAAADAPVPAASGQR